MDLKLRKKNYTDDSEIAKVPFLDPDILVQYLFKTGLTIPQELVTAFWARKREAGEEWALQSPATPQHIPIAIYGDSARLYATQADSKFLGIFISFPLWRPKSTRYSRWCIFSLENKRLYGRETLHTVLSRITFKLNLLFENGIEGPDGVPLRFVCTEIRGDWEWHKQLFDLTSSWKGITSVCFRCDCAARSDNPKKLYYCLDEDPDWKDFTLPEFLANQIKHQPTCALSCKCRD